MTDSRISPYSLNDLKNTTDDALGNYLRGLKFKQDNSKLDVRLALGYTAVIVGGATFVADYKLGWEATKYWTAFAVAAYAVLNGALTYWMWAVEKGLVFEGARDGKKVSLSMQSAVAGMCDDRANRTTTSSLSSPKPRSTTRRTTSRLSLPIRRPGRIHTRSKSLSRRGLPQTDTLSLSRSSNGWRAV